MTMWTSDELDKINKIAAADELPSSRRPATRQSMQLFPGTPPASLVRRMFLLH